MSDSTAPPRARIFGPRGLIGLTIICALLTLGAAPRPAQSQTSPVARAMAAVTTLRSPDPTDRFLGSGIVWGAGQTVVTNAHVVGALQQVRVIDAIGQSHAGRVIARDPVRDVAVIAVPSLRQAGLPLGDMAGPGADVWAIGAPLEWHQSLTRGIISATGRQVEASVPIRFLQHDAAVNPGSSGGALINAAGELLGMNSRIADGSRHYIGIAFAIPAAPLARIVAGLTDKSLKPFPRLGLELRAVNAQIAAALGQRAAGLLVDRAEHGGIAQRAGLMAGDVLLGAGDADLGQMGDLAFAVEGALGAGRLNLTLRRGSQQLQVTLDLASPAAAAAQRTPDASPQAAVRLDALGLQVTDTQQVSGIRDNSPALFSGLVPGDSLLAINGMEMPAAALRKLEVAAPILIRVGRSGGTTLHLVLDPSDRGNGLRVLGGANVLDRDIVVF